jgi:hypothetical protein
MPFMALSLLRARGGSFPGRKEAEQADGSSRGDAQDRTQEDGDTRKSATCVG